MSNRDNRIDEKPKKGFLDRMTDKISDKKTDIQLTKKVEVKDLGGYLKDEFDRAAEREDRIDELEHELNSMKELELKYEALLVIQEKTSERIKRQDEKIKGLKAELQKAQDDKLKLKAKITEIKINARKLAKENKARKSKRVNKKGKNEQRD